MVQENNNLVEKKGTWKAFSEKNNSVCLADEKGNEEWFYISSENKPLKDFVFSKYPDWRGKKVRLVIDSDRVIAIELVAEPPKTKVKEVMRDDISILDIVFTCQWHAVEMLKDKNYQDVSEFLDDLILLRNKLVADIISTYTKK